MAITDEDAEIVEERHFDAWGNVAWIKDDSGNSIDKLTVLDRGYTGHEHLQDVKLIHMNGRLYDPVLRRFLAPDNYVQDPYNTQNFNRYGYVLSNPLVYADPNGEEIFSFIVGGLIIAAAAIFGDWDPPQNDTANQNTGVNTHTSNAGGSSGSIASSMASFHEGVGSHSYSLPNGIRSFNFSNYTTNTIAYSQMQDINKGFSPYNDKPAQQESGFGVNLLDGFQTVLDVVGLVPVVGEIADGANALIYLGRGDYGNAGLSAAAMIPFAGWGATGTKLALKGKKAFDAARTSTASWGKVFNYRHGGQMSAIEHIMYRHSYNTGFSNVSRFAQGTNARMIKGYVDQAVKHGTPIKGGFEYNFGRVIGTGANGAPASSIRVYVRDGWVRTAFPF